LKKANESKCENRSFSVYLQFVIMLRETKKMLSQEVKCLFV